MQLGQQMRVAVVDLPQRWELAGIQARSTEALVKVMAEREQLTWVMVPSNLPRLAPSRAAAAAAVGQPGEPVQQARFG
jgi:hypothetical protein